MNSKVVSSMYVVGRIMDVAAAVTVAVGAVDVCSSVLANLANENLTTATDAPLVFAKPQPLIWTVVPP